MKNEIEDTLKVLIGLPLWDAGRAASLEWFSFGWQRNTITMRNGKTKVVSDYSLHTEATWHIVNNKRIVVASQDRLYPAGENPYKDLSDFDWDKPGVNRCDERISQFIEEHKESPLVVQSLEANDLGGLKLYLSKKTILEIFPASSLDCEYWRFFEPENTTKHFVITAHGIED
ncbi:MAG: hypothetical protein IPP66_23185 [Anaerolineales bacterium]|nr:hypothetical protein [Anaerolineales bacterium]